jgi:hypothetical protein
MTIHQDRLGTNALGKLKNSCFTQHAWKQTACVNPDRKDAVDGWGSPVINWTQSAFHPHLIFDVESYAANPRFVTGWPAANLSSGSPGDTLSREVVIFNDVADVPAGSFTLRWSGYWKEPTPHEAAAAAESAAAPPVVSGSLTNIKIEAGFHARRVLSLKLPKPPPLALATATANALAVDDNAAAASAGAAALLLVLELVEEATGALLFKEGRIRIMVSTGAWAGI